MSRLPALALVLVGTWLSACTFGPRVSELQSAQTPYGARVEAVVGRKYSGELLLVRDDGVVILQDGSNIALVEWRSADEIAIRTLRLRIRGTPPSALQREQLRLVSRHPYGLSDAQMKDLLARHKQTAVEVLKR